MQFNIKTTDEEEDVDRYLFILFVKDYIVNPNLDNSMCNTGAIERFGTMPSLKGKLKEDPSLVQEIEQLQSILNV